MYYLQQILNMDYFKWFAIYTLALIGFGTIVQTLTNYAKRKGLNLLFWIQNKFPSIYLWLSSKWSLDSVKLQSEIEKLIPFAESLQKEIDLIEDEHLKEDVMKIMNKLQHLITSGQNIFFNEPKNILSLGHFQGKYQEISKDLFKLFEHYYYRY